MKPGYIKIKYPNGVMDIETGDKFSEVVVKIEDAEKFVEVKPSED